MTNLPRGLAWQVRYNPWGLMYAYAPDYMRAKIGGPLPFRSSKTLDDLPAYLLHSVTLTNVARDAGNTIF